MNKPKYAVAKIEDIDILVNLNSFMDNSKRAPFKKIKKENSSIVKKFFLSAIINKKQEIFVAKIKKEIIGFIVVLIRSTPKIFKNKNEAVITDLFVKKEFRKNGVAKNLIKKAKQFAKKKSCSYLRLNVSYENKIAQKVYEKAGFKKFAIIYAGEI